MTIKLLKIPEAGEPMSVELPSSGGPTIHYATKLLDPVVAVQFGPQLEFTDLIPLVREIGGYRFYDARVASYNYGDSTGLMTYSRHEKLSVSPKICVNGSCGGCTDCGDDDAMNASLQKLFPNPSKTVKDTVKLYVGVAIWLECYDTYLLACSTRLEVVHNKLAEWMTEERKNGCAAYGNILTIEAPVAMIEALNAAQNHTGAITKIGFTVDQFEQRFDTYTILAENEIDVMIEGEYEDYGACPTMNIIKSITGFSTDYKDKNLYTCKYYA